MQPDQPIHFTEIPGKNGDLGIITLQRPQALNALNLSMLHALEQQLTTWATHDSIKAVLIRAMPGRAFCAGGDIRALYEKKLANDPVLSHFFRDEYKVNHQIFHFPKPYIALLDGITMGGGAGISIHGSHRVATTALSFAMPETGIGYFPDIGASYFLPRLPHRMGYYLGLTGERIESQDCLALRLVDVIIQADAQEQLIKKLVESPLPKRETVTNIIQSFSTAAPESTLATHYQEVETCFAENTVEAIVQALYSKGSIWCLNVAKTLLTKSPTSLKVTLRALQTGAHLDFDACMNMENHLLAHFLQSHDLFEGIRAAVIDKDRAPRWNPATLEEVSVEEVESYFK